MIRSKFLVNVLVVNGAFIFASSSLASPRSLVALFLTAVKNSR